MVINTNQLITYFVELDQKVNNVRESQALIKEWFKELEERIITLEQLCDNPIKIDHCFTQNQIKRIKK